MVYGIHVLYLNAFHEIFFSIHRSNFRYARSQPSPSSTEETAEETTETDSQAPIPDPRQMLQVDPYQQYQQAMYVSY